MFENFDIRLLDDPEFKEDAVREVIIVPMLTRLGYHPTGANRVVRSKNLTQPFIYVGTKKYPVTIIPDYTLLSDERPVLILDAKSPIQNVTSPANVQQAYSYAIHPEIRCKHFALCNGKRLALFTVEAVEPVLNIPFEEFEARWNEIERHLIPKYLLQPELRRMKPDFGFRISQLGLTKDTELYMLETRLGLFSQVTDNLYTATVNCSFGEEEHCVSYDFAPNLLGPMLAGLPQPLSEAFREAISRAPFQACADLIVEVDLRAHLGESVTVQHETFVPLVVDEVLGSRFNLEPVENEPTDIPSHIFRLSKAFKIKTS